MECFSDYGLPYRSERERARLENVDVHSNLFTRREDEDSGALVFSLAPNVQEVCQVVNGFIFVTNAERGRGTIQASTFLHSSLMKYIVCNDQTIRFCVI